MISSLQPSSGRTKVKARAPSSESPRRLHVRRAALALTAACCLAMVGFAGAQTPPATSPAPTVQAPTAIPAPEIPARAEEDAKRIHEITLALENSRELGKVQEHLPRLNEEIETLLRDPRSQPGASLTRLDLGDIRRRWLLAHGELAEWAQLLSQRALEIDASLTELRRLDETWALTARAASAAGVPSTLRERAQALRSDIEHTATTSRERRDAILALQGTLAQRSSTVAEHLRSLEDADAKLRSSLFERDTSPLWATTDDLARDRVWAKAFWGAWRDVRRDFGDYVQAAPVRIACHILASLTLLLVMLRVGRGVTTWTLRDKPDDLTLAAKRPVSSALVLAALLAIPFHWTTAPRTFAILVCVFAAVPVIRVLRVGHYSALPMAPFIVTLLAALDATRALLPAFSALSRSSLLIENMLVAAILTWNLRPSRLSRLPVSDRWRRVIALGCRSALGAVVVACIANVLGNVSLAQLLTDSTLRSIYLALVAWAGTHVLTLLLAAALHSRVGQSSRVVRRHGSMLLRQGAIVIRAAMTICWATGTLRAFTILDHALDALRALLGARLVVGALALSLGDLLALVVTIGVSFILARIVRFVLEENVLPRFSLARGIPGAISVGASYTVLLIGFFAALSAAGLDFGRITVLLGAFSLGLSFGLQNLVNNFVSGMILIFERPIQTGDTIEIEQAFGDVRRIGIRSTTLRTVDGAEVIIPNGRLLDQKLTNWTLSDRERRLEVRVGVAYGTDPRHVLTLLKTVAEGHPDVLKHPSPTSLFEGFGESSLNFSLRAWTSRTDAFLQIRSDLAVLVYEALQEAGIEIPFPQRDIRLRDPAPATHLGAPSEDDAGKLIPPRSHSDPDD